LIVSEPFKHDLAARRASLDPGMHLAQSRGINLAGDFSSGGTDTALIDQRGQGRGFSDAIRGASDEDYFIFLCLGLWLINRPVVFGRQCESYTSSHSTCNAAIVAGLVSC